MSYWIKALLIGLVLSSQVLAVEEAEKKGYSEITWDDLMPEDWIPEMPEPPEEPMIGEEDGEFGVDGFVLPQLEAPIVEALNKKQVKVPGYILPVKFLGKGILEFLLVPYMGACVHVPPPPENQMIYVKLYEPFMMTELWQPVWVSGTLLTQKSLTEYATAGYLIDDALVEPYEY